ncbi:PAS domain-containing protein [Aureimonas endophytica]|nr:PAS domain-containing protein [Aureimonas endophytica]
MAEPRSWSSEALFSGPGDVRARGRTLDWAATPLGPVQGWSQSLRSTVRTLLSSQYPMVLTWGPQFTQIYNDAYSKLIGDRHPSGLGGDIRVTLAEAWDTLGPMIERVMATGVANWTPALPLEMHRSGYREEAYFSVSHAPAENDRGEIVGMLAVCSEVTEQIVGERRLRLLRELAARAGDAQETAAAARDLVAALSEDRLDVPFACVYLRDGDAFGLVASQGLTEDDAASAADWMTGERGLSSVDDAHGGDAALVDGLDRIVTVSGGAYGDPVTSAIRLPIMGAQGAVLGVLIAGVSPNRALDEGYRSFFELLATQVSVALRNARAREDDRRRAEELAELDRAKTAFFSNVSHEFRTPLTLLLGPLEEAIVDEAGTLADHRGELQIAHRNALRLLRLVNTLLDFSRVEADRAEASFEFCDLSVLTADLASNFRSAMEKAGLRLVVDAPSLPRLVRVDRDMFEKIVLNLLSNAFKFTHEGTIDVRLREAGSDAVAFVVSDTGVGIPSDELPRVFERFHRIPGQHARSHEGTGIGLALVRQLVALHGGDIAVESEGPGRGTTFTVVLPYGSATRASLVDAPRDPGLRPQADAFVEEALRWLPGDENTHAGRHTPSPRSRPRIILADDNADMRAYVQRLLGDSYDVIAVADGTQALAAVETSRPDLVVSDIMMPGLDGFALLHAMRSDPAMATVPVIFLSARAGEEARVESLAAGADDHVVKPFGAQELRARIDGVLRLASLRGDAANRERVLEAQLAASKAQVALAHSESQLWTLMDALPVLISHIDRDLRYRFVNRAYETWFSRKHEDVVGKTVAEVVGPVAFEQVRPRIGAALSGQHLSFEESVVYPDVGLRHVRADFIPKRTPEGEVVGFYGLVQDVTEARQQTERLAESERRMRVVLDAVSDGFVAVDANWRITLFNRAAEDAFGRERDNVLGQELWDAFPEVCATPYGQHLKQVMETRTAMTFEEGSPVQSDRFLETRLAGTHDGGLAASFTDITERKVAERHRELLVNELNHRVKNTLAVVQSIAMQSFKDERVPNQARQAFQGRLLALSDAHNLLTQESWETAPLSLVVEGALRPFREGNRFDVQGPKVRVGPKASVSLTLAFHELCTNAVKYGALSAPEGHVTIAWSVTGHPQPTLTIRWVESGGPEVRPPERPGFGSRLVSRGLAAELGGAVELLYPPTGVVCEIAAPLGTVESR